MIFKNREVYRYGTWAYTQVTQLKSDEPFLDNATIIHKIIDSKWFIWQGGKYPEGMIWHFDSTSYENIKVHGFYDANLLTSQDFEKFSSKDGIRSFITYVLKTSEIFIFQKLTKY